MNITKQLIEAILFIAMSAHAPILISADTIKRPAHDAIGVGYVSKNCVEIANSSATSIQAVSSTNQVDGSSALEAYEDETIALTFPAQIKPRYAQLILNGSTCMDAITAALHAESAGLYLSFYKTSAEIAIDGLGVTVHPFLKVLYEKKDQPIMRKIMVDQKKLYDKADMMRPFVNILMASNCIVKESDNAITTHTGSSHEDSLHQKVYLFTNALHGEPVCFIGSHNPTEHSLGNQENSMLMTTDRTIFNQLRSQFLTLFNYHAKALSPRESYKTIELIKRIQEPEDQLTISDEAFIRDAIQLDDTTEVTLLKTPLTRSPGIEIIDEITDLIEHEQDEIYFLHYRLTHARIVRALIEAAERGVKVHIIIDESSVLPHGDSTAHKPGQLAMQVLADTLKKFPNCSFGIMRGGYSYMLHDKTIACADHEEGLIVVGSWNATGNSSYFCCETSIVCRKNKLFFDQIKDKFHRLRTHHYYASADTFIKENEYFKKHGPTAQDHIKFMQDKKYFYSYDINGWISR